MAVQHPFISFFDAIAALRIDLSAKAVLWALARHGHWDTGENCAPSVARIAAETCQSERQVRYVLRALECTSEAQCLAAERRCQHYGLIVETKPAGRFTPATYRLSESMRGSQPLMPEIGRAPDPYARVVLHAYEGHHGGTTRTRGAAQGGTG